MSEKKKKFVQWSVRNPIGTRYLQHVAADRKNRSRSQAGTVCVCIHAMNPSKLLPRAHQPV